MRAKIFVAVLSIFQGAPASSSATPVQRLDPPLAFFERASGGCGSFAYRDPSGICTPYSRRGGVYKGGGHERGAWWERPEWQGGDGGYLSGGAGWRGGGYYGPQ